MRLRLSRARAQAGSIQFSISHFAPVRANPLAGAAAAPCLRRRSGNDGGDARTRVEEVEYYLSTLNNFISC